MSLFIDKHNRRKSPLALAAFGAALLYFFVFGALYALLAEPLYRYVRLGGPTAITAAHSAVITLVGTAACCLLFLLEDKRIAPLGFAGLAVILGMFYAAAWMLEGEARSLMLRLVTMYGLTPVLAGNAVAWSLYFRIKRTAPAPESRKTIQQELLEAAAREAEQRERRRIRQAGTLQGSTPPETAEPPASKPPEEFSPEAALFGPESAGGPSAFHSEEEEAMLLYMDDGDDETDDD